MRANDAIGLLTSAYNDWSGLLVNPSYIRKGNVISWPDFERPIMSDPIRPEEFLDLVDKRQYSFQVIEDGAILQLHYAFDKPGEQLVGASLGFMQLRLDSPSTGLDSEDDIASITEWEQVCWVRMDYDPVAARGPVHGRCHLHLSGLPYSRLLLSTIPTPRQFIEFVVATFYPEMYAKHRLIEGGKYQNIDHMHRVNSTPINLDEDPLCRHIIHLRIPGIQETLEPC